MPPTSTALGAHRLIFSASYFSFMPIARAILKASGMQYLRMNFFYMIKQFVLSSKFHSAFIAKTSLTLSTAITMMPTTGTIFRTFLILMLLTRAIRRALILFPMLPAGAIRKTLPILISSRRMHFSHMIMQSNLGIKFQTTLFTGA